MFFVSKKGCQTPGYIRVNELRQYWENSDKFDEYIKNQILLHDVP